MELEDLSGVGPSTRETLEENGIKDINDLANASIEDISSAGVSSSRAKDIKYKAKQNTIEIQTGLEVQEEYDNKNKIKSNIEDIDEALEGGFQEESVVSIWGESSTGKSQLAQKMLVEGYEQTGKPAILIETEKDRFRPERIKAIANQEDTIENIIRVKAYSIDKQYSAYGKVIEQFDEASVVVVDSLTARIRLSSKFDGRGTLSERSNELGKHLIKLEEVGERLGCPVLFTNQAYKNPDSYGKNVLQYGGSKIKHTSQYHVHMSNAKGDLFEAEIQQHPSSGDTSVLIDIHEEGIDGVN
jgi:RecA/RadA recombinase